MPDSRIIPARPGRTFGGISMLADLIERNPSRKIVIYHRCSSYAQAGKGKIKLEEHSRIVMNDARKIAPRKLHRTPFYGVEEGKLTVRRPTLVEAATYAKQHGLILVAADLSRFVRSELYHRVKNREARPSEVEFDRLRELAMDVPLATVLHPALSEQARHRIATKRNGRQGRPRSITYSQAWRALEMLGTQSILDNRWEMPLADVARKIGVTKSALQRFLESKVPPELVDGNKDVAWKDLNYPARAFSHWRRQVKRDVSET